MALPKPRCEACDSDRRDELDLALTRGMAITLVAQAHALPVETVVWHVERHLRGIPKRVRISPHDLVEDLHYLKSRIEGVLETAIKDEKPSVALIAAREMNSAIMSLAKLTHAEEALDPTTYMPQYAQLKARLLKVVEQHPEIRDKIVAALSLEDKSNSNGT